MYTPKQQKCKKVTVCSPFQWCTKGVRQVTVSLYILYSLYSLYMYTISLNLAKTGLRSLYMYKLCTLYKMFHVLTLY
jgi:hypothetical protein